MGPKGSKVGFFFAFFKIVSGPLGMTLALRKFHSLIMSHFGTNLWSKGGEKQSFPNDPRPLGTPNQVLEVYIEPILNHFGLPKIQMALPAAPLRWREYKKQMSYAATRLPWP